MIRGAWHQFGDRSQILALEQLENGAGVGVVISTRDLSYARAQELSPQYLEHGVELLLDQQFYLPGSEQGSLPSYPIAAVRQSVSQLVQASDSDLHELADALRVSNSAVGASAVLAPAVLYKAGRPDIGELNEKLFIAARSVADDLGLPCYATVALGKSVTSSEPTTNVALAAATALPADGWYYCYEFNSEARVPNDAAEIARYLRTGLTLATTDLPVLSAFAGPLAPLALASGARAVGVGHWQNLWQFIPSRWEPSEAGGGGGSAPPRYFSEALWGTLIYGDEWSLIPQSYRDVFHTPTPFSTPVRPNAPFLPWPRWDANKHLVYSICRKVSELAEKDDAEEVLDDFSEHLETARSFHLALADEGIILGDDTASYQAPWIAALNSVKTNQDDDFEMLRLLGQ